MEDHTGPLLDLAHAGPDIISIVLSHMPLPERFICALVCKAWAEAATAATHTIIKHKTQDISGLQHWLEKHGNVLEVLQLHACYQAVLTVLPCCEGAQLTALPCCAKLQDLLLHDNYSHSVSITSRAWGDIAKATKLTSISLSYVETAAQQADVVSALTALPNLEQMTWHMVRCSNELWLYDSLLLQHLTRLTSLQVELVAAATLQHLGSLTKLQHLSISADEDWAAAGCPGLQELTALTSLGLCCGADLPTSASQLTALRQLRLWRLTPTGLIPLQALSGLTHLFVKELTGLSPESPPLQLPGLLHLDLLDCGGFMPTSFLTSCTQLRMLRAAEVNRGGLSNVPSTSLQHLQLYSCSIVAAAGAADPDPWQQVFPGPGRLPHLTSLQLSQVRPAPELAALERMLLCCSSLKVLQLDTLPSSTASELTGLSGLTCLHLNRASAEQYGALAQLTGLRELRVDNPSDVSAAVLRQLSTMEQLTSLGFLFGFDPTKASPVL